MPTITDFIPIYTAVAVAAVLAVTAVVFRLLTYPGAIVAAATVVLAAVFWGYAGILIYIAPFILNAVFGFVGKKKRRQAEENFHAHTGKRGVRQVICNGAPALIMMGIAFFTRLEVFYVAAAAAVAEGFADSEAGDFGMAFGGKTVNILTFKECERGLSGGVSVVGTVAALVAAAVTALLPIPFSGYGWATFGAVVAGGFLGVMLDSALGASVQALYRCPECGTLTEKAYCHAETQLIRGYKRLDNNAVNIISSFSGAVIAGGIAALILYL